VSSLTAGTPTVHAAAGETFLMKAGEDAGASSPHVVSV